MKTFKLIPVLFLLALLFSACEREENHRLLESRALELGTQISDSTQKMLAGNLKKAIAGGGVFHAIEYCNLEAMPITRKMEEKYGVKIKRTSLKVRNPQDRPDENERRLLMHFDSLAAAGAPMTPAIRWLDDDRILYARPIMLNKGLCLSCHGEIGSAVSDSLYAFIRSKYPEDRATGYKLNDFRGMWSIVFDEEQLEKAD